MEVEQDKLLRSLLAAIVGSNMKAAELRVLATCLSSDPSFGRRLGSLVAAVSMDLEASSLFSEPTPRDAPAAEVEPEQDGVTNLVLSIVKRRRLSKDRLLSHIRSIDKSRRWAYISHDLPIRDLVANFVTTASSDDTRRLLAKLGIDVEDDPFLGEISSRNK